MRLGDSLVVWFICHPHTRIHTQSHWKFPSFFLHLAIIDLLLEHRSTSIVLRKFVIRFRSYAMIKPNYRLPTIHGKSIQFWWHFFWLLQKIFNQRKIHFKWVGDYLAHKSYADPNVDLFKSSKTLFILYPVAGLAFVHSFRTDRIIANAAIH